VQISILGLPPDSVNVEKSFGCFKNGNKKNLNDENGLAFRYIGDIFLGLHTSGNPVQLKKDDEKKIYA